jgi:hypothetical protein
MHINRKAVTWNLKAVSMVWKCARTAVQEPALMSVLVVLFFGFAAVQPAIPYDDEPDTVIDRNVPFEMWAPWYNSDNTEVEDEVLLRGQMHVVIQVWLSGEDHIDRVTFHVNAVGVNGTSETTGQRFRLTGGYTKDLQDPDITLNPDGTIDLPFLEGDLQISKVDPEPARLTQVLSAGGTAGVVFV